MLRPFIVKVSPVLGYNPLRTERTMCVAHPPSLVVLVTIDLVRKWKPIEGSVWYFSIEAPQ